VYYPGGSVVPSFAAPPVYNRAYTIEADVEIPAGGAEGVLMAQGGDAGGYAFYVKDGQLCFVYNYVGLDRFELRTEDGLTEGRHALRYEFEPTGEPDIAKGKGVPGRGQLYIDGKLAANTEYPHTPPLFFELEGLSCGFDFGAPASETYEPPFAFTGTIRQVSVDLAGELIADDEATLRLMMAQQ
jgi:hypothetical protein